MYHNSSIHKRAGVEDGSAFLTRERGGSNWNSELRIAAFALRVSDTYLYRRFQPKKYGEGAGTIEDYGDDANSPLWLKFFRYNNYKNDFLGENSQLSENDPAYNKTYRDSLVNKGISFLGVFNKYQYPEGEKKSYTFYVDTAYVRNNTLMPQYMLALRPQIMPAGKVTIKETDSVWVNGELIIGEEGGSEVWLPAAVRGFYLFNAQDSVNIGKTDFNGRFDYSGQHLTRLAFVDGIHVGDTFYVVPPAKKATSLSKFLLNEATELWTLPLVNKHYLGENTHYVPRYDSDGELVLADKTKGTLKNNGKSMVFQFRLIDENNRRFLIETTQANAEIGPQIGQWVKTQSSVPLISDENTDITNAKQNGAELFDVTNEDVVEGATANEAAPVVGTAKVISEAGAVTILNAAGKKVAISNILGQTIANAVLTSDNARITLPKGIVVVAIEGEPAIKAVVK
jgi:hypothetical protein